MNRRELLQIFAGASVLGLAAQLAERQADATIVAPTTAEVQALTRGIVSGPTDGIRVVLSRVDGDPGVPLLEMVVPVVQGTIRWVARPGHEVRFPRSELTGFMLLTEGRGWPSRAELASRGGR